MTETFAERLPFPFTRRDVTLADSAISRDGREIHYTIAGVPFRTAIMPDLPMTIGTAPTQKAQQDVEPEAGENSLAGWWLRNQNSFHEGAGARYVEARGEVKDTSRFWESSNVDVWTPGQLTMLRRSASVTDGAVKAVAAIPDSTVNSVVVGRVNNVAKYTDLDVGTATTTLFTENSTTFKHVIAGETDWWAIGDVQGLAVRIYTGTLAGGAPTVWQLTGSNPAKPMRILWAKHRLWAINNNKVWVVDVAGGSAGSPVSITRKYEHPSTAFVYTDLCDAPGGVVLAGYGDGSSGLQKITLDATGAVPTISGAQVTAVLPNDERILGVSSLASSMILIQTNRGVRVAVAQDTGEMVYGPRFMERTEVPSTALAMVVSAGRWWWLIWGDQTKVWRIDSSAEVEDGVFAYASDMESTGSAFSGLTVRNERPVVINTSGNLAYRHATELESAGYLTTGRIRYRTDEFKSFQRITATIAPLAGTLEIVSLNDADSERSLITYNLAGQTNPPMVTVPNELNPMRFMSVKLKFTRAGGLTTGPTIYGVQVKALPASKPQRLIQIPLECYDQEYWSTGQLEGYDGFARDRYDALTLAEDSGAAIFLRDYTVEPTIGMLCVIEEMRFVRQTQPYADSQVGSWGGILIVTLRTLT